MGTFILGFLCAVFLIGAVGAAYYLGYANLPSLASLRAATSTSPTTNAVTASPPPPIAPVVAPPSAPPPSLNDNLLSSGHATRESLTAMYAKDWVIADGERLGGITQVMPAPGMQVTIAYAQGAKNVPVSSLPQGFLDLWNVTPAMLETANQPPKTSP